MNPNELCFLPAVELATRIRSRDLSPVEVVDAFLARIEAINPKLNAYVTLHPEASRKAAKRAEDALTRDEALGPLHGVPVSLKDLAATKGVRTTCGSKATADNVPTQNHPVVQRLLDAGAISLGKTNTPEFGWLAITDNDVFGRTNNPWNVDYTPSGSSGGAAAAAAAGLSPIALGSDGGGSIRHPASFCGLFGIKTTFGLIPHEPAALGWVTLSHDGPLTRTVADAALALDVMTGYHPLDQSSAPLPPQNFLANLKRDPKGMRVAWTPDFGAVEVDPEVREAFEKTLAVFKEMGCILEQATPDMTDARDIFKWIMFSEAVGGHMQFFREDGSTDLGDEYAKFLRRRMDIKVRDYMDATHRRRELYMRTQKFFDKYDALLTPTMAIPPFKHPATMDDYPSTVNGVEVGSTGWHPFTFPFNLTGQPAATVPCGFSKAGLPIGLQIVAPRFDDLRVMQIAAAYERANPWASKKPAL